MKNNIFTQSYFIHRLIDNKISVEKLFTYPDDDIRKWIVNIMSVKYDILCTCYKISSKDFWFKFDCQQKSNFIVKTKSMEVIIETVKDLMEGHDKYNELKEENGKK